MRYLGLDYTDTTYFPWIPMRVGKSVEVDRQYWQRPFHVRVVYTREDTYIRRKPEPAGGLVAVDALIPSMHVRINCDESARQTV